MRRGVNAPITGSPKRAWSLFTATAVALLSGCSATNSGGPGNAAPAGDAGAASDIGPIVVSEHVGSIARIASDGSTLFLLGIGGNLTRMPATGGPVVDVVSTGAGFRFIAADDAGFVFLQPDGIYLAAKGEWTTKRIVAYPTRSAAVRSGKVYWTEGESPGGSSRISVRAASMDGSSVATLAEVSVSSVYPFHLAATSTSVFLLSRSQVFKFPITGVPSGETAEEISQAAFCEDAVADDEAIYCCSLTGPITRIANDGTTRELVANANVTSPAVDRTDFYWSGNDPSIGGIMKVSKRGGAPVRVSEDRDSSVAVDAEAIYWESGGKMHRLLK